MADFTGTTSYPSALDTFDITKDNANPIGQDLVDVRAAAVAIQTELGTAPSGSETTVKDRLEQIETDLAGAGVTWPIDHTGAATTTDAITLDVTGDSNLRFTLNHDGKMEWGSGSGASDVSFYREGANELRANCSQFTVLGTVYVTNNLQTTQRLICDRDDVGMSFTQAGANQATVGSAGGASAIPATPTGYLKVQIQGTTRVMPYYAAS